jgi:hypothetical protein
LKEILMTQQHPEANLAEWIQNTVDRTATSIEGIHKAIAAMPLDVMRDSGFFEQTAEDVRELQDRSISAVYETVRDVNRRVGDLASDLLRPASADSEADTE